MLKDIDTLVHINKIYAAVSFTITAADDDLAKKLEPGAPRPSQRYKAMRKLAAKGILTGVTLQPVLPFIEDNPENITAILEQAHENGASYVIPSFGMSLRDRQRHYYYNKLDIHFPGLKEKYIQAFGGNYHAPANGAKELDQLLQGLCYKYKITPWIPRFEPVKAGRQTPRQERLL